MSAEREERQAYQAGLRYLAARPRTVAEMQARLRRTFAGATAEAVTARLTQEGLLDDRAFARQWGESRQRARPRSAALLRYELGQKGVPQEVAQEAVAPLDDEALAQQATHIYARHMAGVDSATFRRRLGQHLHRRGFSPGVIRRAVARLAEEHHKATAGPEQAGRPE